MQFMVSVENVLLQSGKPEDEQRWGSQCTNTSEAKIKEYQMQGWRGVRLAQELETSAKKKKESKHSTSVVVHASKGNLYLRINDSWATFYYLHPHNLANSKRAMYLLQGGKGLFFWCWEPSFPSCHLPPEQCHSPYTQSQQPLCPAHFVLKAMTFCTTPTQKWSCLGCQSNSCCFPRVWQ